VFLQPTTPASTDAIERWREPVRFASTVTALDRLADALRRADASWAGGVPVEWEELRESERAEWRDVASDAATAVAEEMHGSAEVVRPRWARGKKPRR
jgi:hypothetical protein